MSATSRAPTTGSSVTPSTWHCIVTAVPTAATSHQPGRRLVQARHAPASATALDSAIRFGFQMNVDSSTAAGEMAIARPATNPATGPRDRPGQPPRHADRGDPGERDPGRPPPAASRRRSGPRPARGGSSRARRDGRRRSTSAARATGRPRRGPGPATSACRDPGRRPTCRASPGRGAGEPRPADSRPGSARISSPSPGGGHASLVLRRRRSRPAAAQLHRLGRQVGRAGGRPAGRGPAPC